MEIKIHFFIIYNKKNLQFVLVAKGNCVANNNDIIKMEKEFLIVLCV
jgi:hypothetical protein